MAENNLRYTKMCLDCLKCNSFNQKPLKEFLCMASSVPGLSVHAKVQLDRKDLLKPFLIYPFICSEHFQVAITVPYISIFLRD